jgi:ADP-ribose pyrophosphatase
MIKKWTILDEEDVSPSKWFPVRRHTIRLSNDQVIDDFFTAPFGNVAMILPLTKEKEIVFVRQYKHGAGEIFLELPAGFQQTGKTIEESALAELEEETGIRTSLENLVSLGKIVNNPTKTNHTTFGFLASDLTFNSKQAFDSTEDIELAMFSPKEVLNMIGSGEIYVGDTVAFIMKAHLQFPGLFR